MRQLTIEDVGCWYDGLRGGHEIGVLVQKYAIAQGWPEKRVYKYDEAEFHDAWDHAEEWLTLHVAPKGCYFGSQEGDWGLWTTEEDA